ncbi:ABC transporter permease/M1 family aminopeptidase [Zhouia amylolytica]|uniref:ABC transporter permease/M1 family aminopeptidase n=1 Tax=Zhouia amylolytica TaxID=376730 RepID=UPI0020CC532E|nr:M1 family aminopeptidase [Zhouia amylolytica]MCQ0110706.1 hypothetical protein [Zhouia amylolytica]
MFRHLILFEAYYQLRQRAFLWLSILFLGFGILMGKQGATRGELFYNSAYAIAHITSLFTLGSVFIIMFFTVSGILRDKQFNMAPLVYSTPLKKLRFFAVRFLGVYLSSVLTFSMFLIGFLISTFLPGIDPGRISSFDFSHYAWAICCIIMPNIFIGSAIIFSVGLFAKNNIAIYVSAVGIYTLYFISSIYLNSPLMAQAVPASPEGMAIAAISDPFAISAFFEQTQYWTPFQKNTEMIAFSGYFMWNRMLWFTVAFLLLLITFRRFSYRNISKTIKRRGVIAVESKEMKAYQPVIPELTKRSQRQAFLSLLKADLNGVFKSLPFVAISICWIIIVISEIYSRVHQGGQYNDSLYPTTNLLIGLISQPLAILSTILIIFYGGELYWRDRIHGLHVIVDVTPVENRTLYFSKVITLVTLPLVLMVTGILICLGFQMSLGYYNFELKQYLMMLYHQSIPVFIYSSITLFMHTMFNNKYIGMTFTGVLIIVLGTQVAGFLGIEHPLFHFGALPTPGYTNMNGYGDQTKMFNHLALYWLAIAFLLVFFSYKLWKRGEVTRLHYRWRILRSGWNQKSNLILICLSVTFLYSGAVIYHNTNIEVSYHSTADYINKREVYERLYKQYDTLPQLFPLSIKTKVDLYPHKRQFRVQAEYILQNKGTERLTEIFVTEKEPLKFLSFENAALIEQDPELGVYLFQLAEPLAPKDSIQMRYEINYKQKGYEINPGIIENGSYIMHKDFSPVLGYRNSLEIQNSYERTKRDLPPLESSVVSDEHIINEAMGFGKVTYETLISTSIDQIAIGSGDLTEKWTEEDRKYYRYKAKDKVVPTAGYFSACYDTLVDHYKGIRIEQYFHPQHQFNIKEIQRSARYALDYCISNFGNYDFNHLRIAEVPGHWPMGGYAHPGTISMVENRLYLSDVREEQEFNLVAKRTIHEVSHQWWGHGLTPKIVAGGALLIEGLAKYTEAMVMEKMYGKRALWDLSENANRLYFSGRSYHEQLESPLYKVEGERFLSYGKAHTVLYALSELIGESKVNKVLKRLLEEQRAAPPFSVTSIAFINELYKETPGKYHALIDDWFKKIITYDLKVEEVEIKPLENGKYQVSMCIAAKRYQTLEDGSEKKITINEPVPVGVFMKHPSELQSDEDIIYLDNQNLVKEKTVLHFIVDKKPQYVAVDPFGTRLDINRVDNIK